MLYAVRCTSVRCTPVRCTPVSCTPVCCTLYAVHQYAVQVRELAVNGPRRPEGSRDVLPRQRRVEAGAQPGQICHHAGTHPQFGPPAHVDIKVMLEAGEDFLTIKECVGEDGKPDMLLTMDRWGVTRCLKHATDFPSLLRIFEGP